MDYDLNSPYFSISSRCQAKGLSPFSGTKRYSGLGAATRTSATFAVSPAFIAGGSKFHDEM